MNFGEIKYHEIGNAQRPGSVAAGNECFRTGR